MTEIQKYTATRTFDSDSAMSIFGVAGRLKTRTVCAKTKVGCWEHQNWISERRTKVVNGETVLMHAEIRFDDHCHNGHNDFAITGFGWYDHYKSRDWDFGGCCHEMIAEVFPELEPLIKWHLVSTDSPMHYLANALYLAGDLDHNGRRKGEPSHWEERVKFGDFPITFEVGAKFLAWLKAALEHRAKTLRTNPQRKDFQVVEVPHVKKPGDTYDFQPHYSFDDFTDSWYDAPFKSQAQALEWQTALLTCDMQVVRLVTGYSKGKERELDKARSVAKWPEATDEQLCLPREELKALLEARLPGMMAEFRKTMDDIGMLWSPEDYKE